MPRRNAFIARLLAGLLAGLAAPAALAHGARLGSLEIDHPYALPTATGVPHGAAYLRGIRNRGEQPDRLLGANWDQAH
jgi:periplasmic copper chaperone A